MYLWQLVWIICILVGIKLVKENNSNGLTDSLSYINTLPIRGILAIEILFGHLHGDLENEAVVYINNKIGVLVVGMFLFLSGWGLYESKCKKESYFQGFIRKHLISLLLPLYIAYVICVVLLWTDWTAIEPKRLMLDMLGRMLLAFANWYVWELLILYLLFYLLYQGTQEKYANIFLLVIMLSAIIIGTYFNIGSRWYGSLLCFLMGILVSQYKEEIYNLLTKRYWKIAVSIGIVFILCLYGYWLTQKNIYWNSLFICLSAVLSSCLMVIALVKIRIRNRVTLFLGEISYEIFIMHQSIIGFCKRKVLGGDFVFVLYVLFLTISLAYCVMRIKKIFKQKMESNRWALNKKMQNR